MHTQGHPNTMLVQQFFAVGYSQAALVEVVGLVAAGTFQSYVTHLAARLAGAEASAS